MIPAQLTQNNLLFWFEYFHQSVTFSYQHNSCLLISLVKKKLPACESITFTKPKTHSQSQEKQSCGIGAKHYRKNNDWLELLSIAMSDWFDYITKWIHCINTTHIIMSWCPDGHTVMCFLFYFLITTLGSILFTLLCICPSPRAHV